MFHRSLIARSLLLILSVSWTTPLALAQADVDDILAKVRSSLGITEEAQSWQVEGTSRELGLEGPLVAAFDSEGRFATRTGDRLRRLTGFDGETAWEVGWNGTRRILALMERERALAMNWIWTGHWSREAAPFDIERVSEEPLTLALSIQGGHFRMEMVLGDDFRPEEARWSDQGVDHRLVFSDWKSFGALWIPGEVSQRASVGESGAYRHTGGHAHASWVVPPWQVPNGDPIATEWTGAGGPLEVQRAKTGHLLIPVRLNEGEPCWFIFDSGAGSMCIDKEYAGGLGLQPFGHVTATGVGGPTPSGFRQADSIQVGDLRWESPIFVELDLAFLTKIFGIEVAGICGFEVIARSVADIDLKEGRIGLYDPWRFALKGAEWQGLVLHERHPVVLAKFEGDREGLFKIDTGAVGTVSFHAPFVKEWNLLEGRDVERRHDGGVGGKIPVMYGPIEYFELGGRRFERPNVGFATEDKGAFADQYTAGNLGSTFFEPFHLVLDYGRNRMALVPRD
ncbi:MAG: retropepsin-like aspartic protease [Planctomycetota bacterium]